MPTLLVIDDDPTQARVVARIFRDDGTVVVEPALDGSSGLTKISEAAPDVVILDVQMPRMNGLSVLESINRTAPLLPVIMLTADNDLKTAIRATRLGAFDYLTKPVNPDEVMSAVQRALETVSLRREVEALRRNGPSADLTVQMGRSAFVRDLAEQVKTVAPTNFSVLVLGETGTGKELVAQAIHRESQRRTGPFVALDCGAIPEALLESELFGHQKGAFTGADKSRAGRFQLAEGGTMFLDEIGNLPMNLQSKLLRVLESKEVVSVGGTKAVPMDVRFVAATNDDLEARATAGLFRSDLYFRLAQYTVMLPPLRSRREDIAYLAARFIDEVSVELRRPVRSIDPAAIALLEQQPWPGNVRELRNVVRQAVLRSKDLIIREEDVRVQAPRLVSAAVPDRRPTPPPASASASLKEIANEAASAAERHAICETLRKTKGNQSETARALGTDFKTLYRKMKKLGIRPADYLG